MDPIQEKFTKARKEIGDALIERDTEVDLCLTAMIAQEHPLLVGPPGTAKSLLGDSLVAWMEAKRFSILFTKFTTPEEVFGPISVAGLKEDRYRRVTTGKLPEAHVGFGDEIFKASSAILNTTLRILNERVFENGDGSMLKVPLRIFIAASNEWPGDQEGGKELGALFDRFLFRKRVRPIITAEGRRRLLWERDHTPKFSTNITPAEIDKAHSLAAALPWTEDGKKCLDTILTELRKEGITPGDRRQYKSIMAAQSYAYLCGADQVQPDHLEILSHTLWDDPAEQPDKVATVVAKIANPIGLEVNSRIMETEQILSGINFSNSVETATAATKLREIQKKLEVMKSADPRVVRAIGYVKEKIKAVKIASIEAL